MEGNCVQYEETLEVIHEEENKSGAILKKGLHKNITHG